MFDRQGFQEEPQWKCALQRLHSTSTRIQVSNSFAVSRGDVGLVITGDCVSVDIFSILVLVLSLGSLFGEQGSRLHPAASVSDWAFVSRQQLPVSLTSTTPDQAASKHPEAPLHL